MNINNPSESLTVSVGKGSPPMTNKLIFNSEVLITRISISHTHGELVSLVELLFGDTEVEFYLYDGFSDQFTHYLENLPQDSPVTQVEYKVETICLELHIQYQDGEKYSFMPYSDTEEI